ncbi:hypothetical protein B0H16DRAFT_1887230 [Mycena metata]|uniref:Uncharacterized protein n=1 Tax=Mycena metata TaxID=1033252 RepID=A0AAD7IIB3_9AGAR|nr:hypothetical protein B0H16DRAFT_1890196 [Mycena metata]KAJ7752693.1 hypothetical protein B0H16DRAFT_1887230 [Mycena metata]
MPALPATPAGLYHGKVGGAARQLQALNDADAGNDSRGTTVRAPRLSAASAATHCDTSVSSLVPPLSRSPRYTHTSPSIAYIAAHRTHADSTQSPRPVIVPISPSPSSPPSPSPPSFTHPSSSFPHPSRTPSRHVHTAPAARTPSRRVQAAPSSRQLHYPERVETLRSPRSPSSPHSPSSPRSPSLLLPSPLPALAYTIAPRPHRTSAHTVEPSAGNTKVALG